MSETVHSTFRIGPGMQWENGQLAGGGGAASWGGIGGDIANQQDLQTAFAGYAAAGHHHNGVYATAGHNHDGAYATANHTHPASDAWTYQRLASDFTTSSATAVDITGLAFTPAANTRYEFEAQLMLRTATATVNPRAGVAWPTGMTDGVANIDQAQSATAILMARGNIAGPLLVAVGGLPNTTQSWPATVWGIVIAGASPSGALRLQLASETAGTVVRAQTGSFLKYRAIP